LNEVCQSHRRYTEVKLYRRCKIKRQREVIRFGADRRTAGSWTGRDRSSGQPMRGERLQTGMQRDYIIQWPPTLQSPKLHSASLISSYSKQTLSCPCETPNATVTWNATTTCIFPLHRQRPDVIDGGVRWTSRTRRNVSRGFQWMQGMYKRA
jgi:hypothetical protein